MKSKTLIIAEAGVNHNGDMNLAKKLIDGGANPNKTGIWGDTPLIRAVESNKKTMVKLLMDNGADKNIYPNY